MGKPHAAGSPPGWYCRRSADDHHRGRRIVAYTSLVLTVVAMIVGFGDLNGLVQRPYPALFFGRLVLLAGIAPRPA